MLRLLELVALMMHLGATSAQNDTIVHGWVPEPQGRGTLSLLYSCLATILLCTWSVLHLQVPKRHGIW